MGSKYLKAWKIGIWNFSTPRRDEKGRNRDAGKDGSVEQSQQQKKNRSTQLRMPSSIEQLKCFSFFFSSSPLNTFQINFEFLLFDGFGSMLFLMFNFTATGWWWWCWLEHISWYPNFLRFSSHWRHHPHSAAARLEEVRGKRQIRGKKVFTSQEYWWIMDEDEAKRWCEGKMEKYNNKFEFTQLSPLRLPQSSPACCSLRQVKFTDQAFFSISFPRLFTFLWLAVSSHAKFA